MHKTLIVIAGWYFNNAFYEKIYSISFNKGYDVLISTHRDKEFIPSKIVQYGFNIHYFDNNGYDWGMYSKALNVLGDKKEEYQYIVFLHDDVEILNNDFIYVLQNYMSENNILVLGNSFSPNTQFPLSHKHVILWMSHVLNEKIQLTEWPTVRGSAFLVNTCIFDKIPAIPYKSGPHVGHGNWSVILFGYLVKTRYGESSITTYSNYQCHSELLREGCRGNLIQEIKVPHIEVVDRPLKINLGCGNIYLEGYLNIDAFSEKADIKKDINDLNFDEKSVSEIIMIHVIEHFHRDDALKIFKKLFYWLSDEGKLIIECPDIEKVAKLVLKHKKNFKMLENGAEGLRGFFGAPTEDMVSEDIHKWGYSEFTLKRKLLAAGFQKIVFESPHAHGQRQFRDLRAVAYKKKIMSHWFKDIAKHFLHIIKNYSIKLRSMTC